MERTLSLNLNSDNIKSGLGQVDRALKKTGSVGKRSAGTVVDAFKNVSRSVFSLKGALIGLIGAAGLGAVSKSFLDAAVVTEGFKTRLTVLLGSVEEGNQLFQDMSQYASEVPFEFEGIMQSATQLAGVLKGGVKEIGKWMPLIGDLAATSGLSIEQTTDQVSRMLSAGAGAADLFRDRGITAMLGFQAGVSVSADETRKKLMEAWKSPVSQFAGATKLLASNWTGLTSMMADKWFAVRNIVMDAGIMDFIKAIGITINQYLGDALETSKSQASSWANFVINGMRSVMNGVAFLVDAIHGISVAFDAVQLIFSRIATGIVKGIYAIADGWRLLANLIPGVDIGPMTMLDDLLVSMDGRTKQLAATLETSLGEAMPGDKIKAFADTVEVNFKRIQDAAAKVVPKALTPDVQAATFEPPKQEMATLATGIETLQTSLLTEEQRISESYERRQFMVEDAFQNAIIGEQYKNELLLGLATQHEVAKTKLAEEQEAKRRAVMAAGLGAAAGIFSNLAALMQRSGKKQNAAQKILAKAGIIASTAQAVMNALAVPPYPLGVSLATAAALQGAVQLKNLGASGGPASSMAPVSSAPSLAATPISTAAQNASTQQSMVVNLTVVDQYGNVLERIKQDVNDHGEMLIDPSSQNGQFLISAGG